MKHYSVMLNEVIQMLDIKSDGIYVDATLGRAGHSLEIVKKLKDGHLYCFDKDITAINESKVVLKEYLDKVTFIHEDFSKVIIKLNELNIFKIDGFIMDLGVSSPQFDDALRGFSYRFDNKLDMRMNQQQDLSAYNVVNEYDFNKLVSILYKYGEEKNAKLIARGIEKNRPIETTLQLVEVIKKSLPSKVLSKKGHPAKQTFQAIRIEVNNELEPLYQSVLNLCEMLKENGVGCVLTFHSLEDRIVKNVFNDLSSVKKVDKKIPILPNEIEKSNYSLINKKVVIATNKELEENKRSHSAKLRGIKRL